VRAIEHCNAGAAILDMPKTTIVSNLNLKLGKPKIQPDMSNLDYLSVWLHLRGWEITTKDYHLISTLWYHTDNAPFASGKLLQILGPLGYNNTTCYKYVQRLFSKGWIEKSGYARYILSQKAMDIIRRIELARNRITL